LEDRVSKQPRLIVLDAYLQELGVSREDLLADPDRPLISRIGEHDYVDAEDARRFENGTKANAFYARAGLPQLPRGPDPFEPRRPLETEAA
jgi:hypothetical protein